MYLHKIEFSFRNTPKLYLSTFTSILSTRTNDLVGHIIRIKHYVIFVLSKSTHIIEIKIIYVSVSEA